MKLKRFLLCPRFEVVGDSEMSELPNATTEPQTSVRSMIADPASRPMLIVAISSAFSVVPVTPVTDKNKALTFC